MEYTKFFRKPFVVEAVQVTEENINEIAEFVGTICKKDDGTPYIQVDRRLIPNVFRVYPGFWVTRLNDNIRCYSSKIFNQQFSNMTDEAQTWIDFLSDHEAPTVEED